MTNLSILQLASIALIGGLLGTGVMTLFMTIIDGTMVKVIAWYDNEWGFSNRMLDTTVALVNAK